jgi:hypothetical protein
MGVFEIVIEKPAEVSRSGECVWYSHGKTCFSMTISNIPITSTDFSRVFHDYVKHTPLQLTSADFSMTMSSTHLFHWLQQVFPWLCQAHMVCLIWSWKNLVKSVETMGVFDIVMDKPAEVSRGDGCVWYSHEKTCWSQSKRWVCLI